MYHITLCSDENNYSGLLAVINSIKMNTKRLNDIKFHILVYENSDDLAKKMDIAFAGTVSYEIKELSKYSHITSFLNDTMVIHGGEKFKHILNIMNFARFYMPIIFEDVDFGLYLDTDMIVLTDITNIFNEVVLDDSLTIAVPNKARPVKFFSGPIKYVLGFNAGIYILNFVYWRNNNILSECEKIMVQNKENRMFDLGTQPILNLIFNKNWKPIDRRWNFTNLGSRIIDDKKTNSQFVLHWTGTKKPWLDDGLNKEYWEKYKINII